MSKQVVSYDDKVNLVVNAVMSTATEAYLIIAEVKDGNAIALRNRVKVAMRYASIAKEAATEAKDMIWNLKLKHALEKPISESELHAISSEEERLALENVYFAIVNVKKELENALNEIAENDSNIAMYTHVLLEVLEKANTASRAAISYKRLH